MNKEELISIIVPVYKVEKYLEKCVDSLICQTYKNLEIILVDDGSPDSCPQLCDEYAKKDNRIKVIHKQNGGLSSARNAGLDLCSGSYICFVDSDDWVNDNFCEHLLKMAKEYDADFSMCEFIYQKGSQCNNVSQIKEKIIYYSEEQVLDQLQETDIKLLSIACAKLYKRKLFNTLRYPLGRLHEDEFILHHILFNSNSLVYSNLPLYNYFIREGSITHSMTDKNIEDKLLAFKERYEYLKINGVDNNRCANIYMNGLKSIYNGLNKKQKKYKKIIFEKFLYIYKQCECPTKKNKIFRFFKNLYKFLFKIKQKRNFRGI